MAFKLTKDKNILNNENIYIPFQLNEVVSQPLADYNNFNKYYCDCIQKIKEVDTKLAVIFLYYDKKIADSKRVSLKTAISLLNNFCLQSDATVYLMLPENDTNYLSESYDNVKAYLKLHYEERKGIFKMMVDNPMMEPIGRGSAVTWGAIGAAAGGLATTVGHTYSLREKKERKNSMSDINNIELINLLNDAGETFQELLFRFIDKYQRDDVEVYKGARKDRKFFYKIKKNVNYQPTKHTVFAFAISLKLTLIETKELLSSAGLALSSSSVFDIIIQYALENHIYDIDEIDYILCDYGQEKYIFNQC